MYYCRIWHNQHFLPQEFSDGPIQLMAISWNGNRDIILRSSHVELVQPVMAHVEVDL
jgi:hypothetical protein